MRRESNVHITIVKHLQPITAATAVRLISEGILEEMLLGQSFGDAESEELHGTSYSSMYLLLPNKWSFCRLYTESRTFSHCT